MTMNGARLARNDILVLGALALLVAAVLLIPWSRVGQTLKQSGSGEYAFANIRRDLSRPGQSSPDWPASTDYVAEARYFPASGVFHVTLKHRHDVPLEGLRLTAAFSGGPTRETLATAWLRHESGGRYSASGVKLPRGDWVVSLTASRSAGPLFRLEQVVTVD